MRFDRRRGLACRRARFSYSSLTACRALACSISPLKRRDTIAIQSQRVTRTVPVDICFDARSESASELIVAHASQSAGTLLQFVGREAHHHC